MTFMIFQRCRLNHQPVIAVNWLDGQNDGYMRWFNSKYMHPLWYTNIAQEKDKEAAKKAAKIKCDENYGRAPWGCRWFHDWKANVEQAVLLGQHLHVFYFEAGWCFGTCILLFPFSWECHHPNWRTHIFPEGANNHQPGRHGWMWETVVAGTLKRDFRQRGPQKWWTWSIPDCRGRLLGKLWLRLRGARCRRVWWFHDIANGEHLSCPLVNQHIYGKYWKVTMFM